MKRIIMLQCGHHDVSHGLVELGQHDLDVLRIDSADS
jgi:hypothetical protein